MTIGNWLKKNWVNCIKVLGATATTVGFTGAAIHDMKKDSCCSMGSSIFTGWMNNSCSPMDMFSMMNGCPLDSMMGGFNSMYGANAAYLSGAQAFQQSYMQLVMQNSQLPYQQNNSLINPDINVEVSIPEAAKVDNKCASAISADQDTELGDDIATAMHNEDGSFKIKGYTADNYKQAFSNTGKSYGAVLDTNDDGFVSEEEYINSEIKHVSSDKKDDMKKFAKIAFNKIDINGDGKLDWKELSATLASFDSFEDNKLDGNITNNQFSGMGEYLGTAGENAFDKRVRSMYKKLFGEE